MNRPTNEANFQVPRTELVKFRSAGADNHGSSRKAGAHVSAMRKEGTIWAATEKVVHAKLKITMHGLVGATVRFLR